MSLSDSHEGITRRRAKADIASHACQRCLPLLPFHMVCAHPIAQTSGRRVRDGHHLLIEKEVVKRFKEKEVKVSEIMR